MNKAGAGLQDYYRVPAQFWFSYSLTFQTIPGRNIHSPARQEVLVRRATNLSGPLRLRSWTHLGQEFSPQPTLMSPVGQQPLRTTLVKVISPPYRQLSTGQVMLYSYPSLFSRYRINFPDFPDFFPHSLTFPVSMTRGNPVLLSPGMPTGSHKKRGTTFCGKLYGVTGKEF